MRLEQTREDQKYRRNLIYLQIENFKCFKEKTTVGPFDKITGVIGPNGSGKSTTIEALSFALCKDHVLRNRNFNYKEIASASIETMDKPIVVELCFTLDNAETLLIRSLDNSNHSSYFINDIEVDRTDYMSFLKEKALLGFPIMAQDELQIFTSKSSKDLMALFEQICGSYEYKKQYEDLQRELVRINSDIVERNEAMRNMKKDRKNCKTLVSSNERVHELTHELKDIDEEMFKAKELNYQKRIEDQRIRLEHVKSEIEEIEAKIQSLRAAIEEENYTADMKKETANEQLRELYNDLSDAQKRKRELDSELSRIDKQVEYDNTKLAQLQDTLLKNNERKKLILQEIKGLNEKINNLKQSSQSSKHKTLVKSEAVLKFLDTHSVLDNQLDLNSSKNQLLLNQIEQISEQKTNINSSISITTNELSDLKAKLQDLKNELANLEFQENDIQKQLSGLSSQVTGSKGTKSVRSELEAQKRLISQKLEQCRTEEENQREDKNLIQHLSETVKGFEGEFLDQVEVTDQKYAIAISVALKRLLDYLIVDSISTSKKVSSMLKSSFIEKTLLVLENAPKAQKDQLAEIRAQLGAKGQLAFDLLHVNNKNRNFTEFLVYYLKNTVICDNMKTAYEIKRAMQGRAKNIITLKGDIVTDEKIESNGSEAFPLKIRRFLKKQKLFEKESLQTSLKNIEQKLKEAEVAENEGQVRKLELDLEGIKASKKQVLDLIHNTTKDIKVAENTLENLNGQLMQLNSKYQELKSEQEATAAKSHQLEVEIKALKKELLKSQPSLKNFNEIESIIASTKNVESQRLKLNEEIESLNLMIENLKLGQLQQEIEQLITQLSALVEQRQRLNSERSEAEQLIGTKDKEIANCIKQLETLNNDKSTRKTGKAAKSSEVSKLEETLGQFYDEERTLIKELQRLKAEHNNFLDDEQMNDHIADLDIKRKVKERSIKISSGSSDINTIEEGSQLDIDFSSVYNHLGVSSSQEVGIEQLDQHIKALAGKRELVEKDLKSLTTTVNAEEFIALEKAKIEDLNEKLEAIKANLSELVKLEQKTKEQLVTISDKRNSLLTSFLNPLALIINDYFKFVNCDERAQAGFVLEVPLKPFLGGIIYSATPPNKRHTIGTESLSSAEASLANLALFLALNEVRNSPFVIFDEIDAHLDADNVYKFVSACGKFSNNRQVVFVSHKPFVFKQASVLIGVTKHPQSNTVACYSLNLDNFRE